MVAVIAYPPLLSRYLQEYIHNQVRYRPLVVAFSRENESIRHIFPPHETSKDPSATVIGLRTAVSAIQSAIDYRGRVSARQRENATAESKWWPDARQGVKGLVSALFLVLFVPSWERRK
jgi:hypothetical protein